MAKASELAARMRETALKEKPKPTLEAVPQAEEEVVDEVSTSPTTVGEGSSTKPVRRKPITTSRYTIDLAQNQRKALKLYALNLDCDASEVVRALLSMLQESKEVQAEVSSRVQAARSTAVAQ